MQSIKAVLWDNDGVLVDTESLFYASNRDLLREHGVELSPRQFFDWFLRHHYGAWHLLRGKGYSEARIAALRGERDARFGALLAAAGDLAVAGIEAVLASLWRRVPMAVVTGSHGAHFRQSQRAAKLTPYFDFAVTREMYADSKPAPDAYLMGLQRLGLAAADCVAVEDSPRGLRAANAAGLECIVVRTALNREHAFDQAFCVVESMAELDAVLGSFLA